MVFNIHYVSYVANSDTLEWEPLNLKINGALTE